MARDPLSDYITAADVAKALGITRAGVSRAAKALGIQPALTVGKSYLYRRSDLKRFNVRKGRGRPRTSG